MNTPDELSAAGTAPVDFDQLQAACDGNAELMRELVDLYFKQAEEIMTGLQGAIKTGSIGEVNHLAHKLAGSSLACGMSAVVEPVRSLEHGAKEGHLRGADGYYAQAAARLASVRRSVATYLAQTPAA